MEPEKQDIANIFISGVAAEPKDKEIKGMKTMCLSVRKYSINFYGRI